MRHVKNVLIITMLLSIFMAYNLNIGICSTVTHASANQSSSGNASSTPSLSSDSAVTKVKNGWIHKNNKTYYYISGKKTVGWRKIGSYTYYFNKSGVMQRKKMISKNKFVNGSGHLIKKSEIYNNGIKGIDKLKTKINKKIKSSSGTISVYVKNLNTNEYMVINNKKMYPASTIKLYCMEAIYDKIKTGDLKMTDEIKRNLNSMITVSSNESYNFLVKKLGNGSMSKGLKYLKKYCNKQGYTRTNPADSLPLPDYNHMSSIKSYTCVRDLGHLIENAYRGTMVNSTYSKKAVNLMLKQTRRGKIPAGLKSTVKCGNKTGEIPGMEHDAAFVYSAKADYVIVIMTKGDPNAIADIRAISKITYNYFNQKG